MPSDTVLKDYIDQQFTELNAKWSSSIFMPALVDSVFMEKCDILQFVNDHTFYGYDSPRLVRFSTEKYSLLDGFEGNGFKELCKDVMKASIKSGFKVSKNGNYEIKSLNIVAKRFSCTRSFVYRGDKSSRSDLSYRNLSYHNDRKNNRGKKGIHMSRRSKTSRSLTPSCRCRFFFLIHFDLYSFYVVSSGYGSTIHSHHHQLSKDSIPFPTRLLTDSENQLINDMYSGQASTGVIANVVYGKTGHI